MPPAIEDLERALELARARTLRSLKAARLRHGADEVAECRAASRAELEAERELSLARGEPTAISVAWPIPWDGGAPEPHIVSSGLKALLLYRVREPAPQWDGNTVRLVDAEREEESIALVEFPRCYAYRFGGPNDEVFDGHPLCGHGLESYAAHRVENSPWIAQEKRTNSVHSMFREAHWTDRTHYLLLFHDNLFECIARGYKVERLRTTFRRAVDLAAQRLFER